MFFCCFPVLTFLKTSLEIFEKRENLLLLRKNDEKTDPARDDRRGYKHIQCKFEKSVGIDERKYAGQNGAQTKNTKWYRWLSIIVLLVWAYAQTSEILLKNLKQFHFALIESGVFSLVHFGVDMNQQ